jgi:hypothetical protein
MTTTVTIEKGRPANMRLASCGVKCLHSDSVFQINFSAGLTVLCSEVPHERQAQKRWWQPYETDSATIDGVTIRRLMTVPVSVSSADFDVVFQRCAFCFSLVSGDSNSTSYGLC